jgi:hypothetical protein
MRPSEDMSFRCLFIALVLLTGLLPAFALSQDEAQDARVQQYVQLLQPAMWRELDFVRQVCDLTPEQRPKIKTAADASVKEAAKAMFQPQGARFPATASQKIHDGVYEALKKTLTAEQLKKYSAEDASRTDATKQATIDSTISQFDGALYFNPEQREKIARALDANWQRDWVQWLDMRRYGEQYFPQVPEEHVVPHLTEEQKTVWNGLQRTTIYGWHNDGRRAADDAWWNPQPAKKATGKAAPAKGKGALLQPVKKQK